MDTAWCSERQIRHWLICLAICQCGGRSEQNVGLQSDATDWN
jgi:hypothetical protein